MTSQCDADGSFPNEASLPNAGGKDEAHLCPAAADETVAQCNASRRGSESSDDHSETFHCNASENSTSFVSPEERAWRRLLDQRRADGYRDGMAVATAPESSQLQRSFNSGFVQCFSFCMRLAKLRGLLAAVVIPLKTASDERSMESLSAATGTSALVYSSAGPGGCQLSDTRLNCAIERIARLEEMAKAFAAQAASDGLHVEERFGHELAELASFVDVLLGERGLLVNQVEMHPTDACRYDNVPPDITTKVRCDR